MNQSVPLCMLQFLISNKFCDLSLLHLVGGGGGGGGGIGGDFFWGGGGARG
jgi:hypothetical protein